MRTSNVFLLCIALTLFSFTSCDNTDIVIPNEVPTNTITVPQAKAWINKWKTEPAFLPSSLKGFTLPKADLVQVLGEGIDSARFYIGKKPSTGEIKLMVLGVNSSGQDMYNTSLEQFIYDFSSPCPTDCGSLVD